MRNFAGLITDGLKARVEEFSQEGSPVEDRKFSEDFDA
jgi:hypothetical protein